MNPLAKFEERIENSNYVVKQQAHRNCLQSLFPLKEDFFQEKIEIRCFNDYGYKKNTIISFCASLPKNLRTLIVKKVWYLIKIRKLWLQCKP